MITLPAFYSVQTIWAESLVGALMATGQGERLKEFNVPYLYAWLLVFYSPFRRRVLRRFGPALSAVGAGMIGGAARCTYYVAFMWALRAKSLVGRLFGFRAAPPVYRKQGATSIQEAAEDLREYLQRSGRHFPA